MDLNILTVYNNKTGISNEFFRASRFLYEKYGGNKLFCLDSSINQRSRYVGFNEAFEKEFNGSYNEDNFTVTFESENHKKIFLLRFS